MRGESVRLCFVGILFFTLSVARSQLPSVSLPCSIRGVALVGGDLADSDGGGGFAAEDAAECQYECDRRANCNFWSHVQEWKVRLELHSIWFIRNTSKFPICLLPKFSINSLMTVAYLFLKILIILSKLFLKDKLFLGHLSTKFHGKRKFVKLKLMM